MKSPFNWLHSAQNWFTKTERSSGFRPYLIFIIFQIGFLIVVFTFFYQYKALTELCINSLNISFVCFIIFFGIKSFFDPNFCRSEKHIETLRKIDMSEQKGDMGPIPIEIGKTVLKTASTLVIDEADKEK